MPYTDIRQHHGQWVTFLPDIVEQAKEDFCLCFAGCKHFKPGPDNCPIAQANFEICTTHHIMAPVVECPEYAHG